jgi:hypothetical protein
VGFFLFFSNPFYSFFCSKKKNKKGTGTSQNSLTHPFLKKKGIKRNKKEQKEKWDDHRNKKGLFYHTRRFSKENSEKDDS